MENSLDPLLTKLCDEVTVQEEQKGFFNSLVGSIKANTCLFEWADEQLSNKIYGSDFIKRLVEKPEIFNFICESFNVSEVYRKKCNKITEKLMLEAEKLWNARDYEKCIQHCSGMILRANGRDVKGRNLLQKALLLRSRCLLLTKKYVLAKEDVSLAIRMGSFLEEKMKNDLKDILSFLKGINNSETVSSAPIIPLGISGSVDLTESDELGRYYVASQDIKIGDNLIIEKPYSSYLTQNCFGTHCHHCFNRLEAPVGCPDCSTVAFCSAACLEEAISTYHQYECKYMELFIGSGMAILCFVALRVVTQIGLEDSLKLYNKYICKTNEMETIESSSKYDHDSFFKLCTHEENRSSQDYVRRTLITFFLLRCLRNTFFKDSNEDKSYSNKLSAAEFAVWSLLLRTLQLLQFNAHQIMDSNISKEIGYGLFPKTSMMNHQCSPNVTRLFHGKHMIIKALQPIQKGQMIGDSYGPQWGRSLKGGCGQKRDERRTLLSSRYWFFCQCITCNQNWPTPPPEIPFLRCVGSLCDGNIDNEKLKCNKCSNFIVKEEQINIKNKLEICIENIKETFLEDDFQKKEKTLCFYLYEYWQYTRMPCPTVIKAENLLRKLYSKHMTEDKIIIQ